MMLSDIFDPDNPYRVRLDGVVYESYKDVIRRAAEYLEKVDEGEIVPMVRTFEAYMGAGVKRLKFYYGENEEVMAMLYRIKMFLEFQAASYAMDFDPKAFVSKSFEQLEKTEFFDKDPNVDTDENPNSDTPNKFTFEIVAPK